jgi:hypothetical protein
MLNDVMATSVSVVRRAIDRQLTDHECSRPGCDSYATAGSTDANSADFSSQTPGA